MATLAPCPHCDDLELRCRQLGRSLERLRAAEDEKFAALQRVLGREIARRLGAEAECLRLRQKIGALHDQRGREADPRRSDSRHKARDLGTGSDDRLA